MGHPCAWLWGPNLGAVNGGGDGGDEGSEANRVEEGDRAVEVAAPLQDPKVTVVKLHQPLRSSREAALLSLTPALAHIIGRGTPMGPSA